MLFSFSFSIMHDFTFNIIDNHSDSNALCCLTPNKALYDKSSDTLCKVHSAYHSLFIILQEQIIADKPLSYFATFQTTKKLTSTTINDFLKPPIDS